MQIDVGFGSVVTPRAQTTTLSGVAYEPRDHGVDFVMPRAVARCERALLLGVEVGRP